MSEYKPLVTVMIPTYNQDKYIESTINSVLNQTYENIQIVVSDDSSNELTKDIINLKYKYKVIYVHNKPSRGRTNNYKHILNNLATGEWVVNLDGDDYFENNDFIKETINLIEKNMDIVLVFTKQIVYDTVKNEKRYNNNFLDTSILSGDWLFLNSIYQDIEIPHLGTIYNRQKAIELEFYDSDRISSDRESLLKLCLNNKVAFLNIFSGIWVHHGTNVSQKIDLKKSFDNLKMYDELFKFACNKSSINQFSLFFWKCYAKFKGYRSIIYRYLISKRF